jgi:5-methyltetrahydropteroyltriglutamate--homocysteine methyltransferase
MTERRQIEGLGKVDQFHLTGVFPRSEQLVEVSRRLDRGLANEAELQNSLDDAVQGLIQLQIENQFDLLVDGQLNWQDLFRPFIDLFSGIEPGSLTRWFDNNTFFRAPVVKDKVRRSKVSIDKYFLHTPIPDRHRKSILPGPFTFAKLSRNDTHASFADLVDDLAHALAEVASELTQKGYTFIQFNEPSLFAADREELEAAKHGFETLAKISSRIMIQTYFGSIHGIIAELLDFPVNCIGIDLYANDITDLSQRAFDRELSCGCVDGRNSLLESPEHIIDLMTKVRDSVEPRQLYVGPNCDLEFLPYSVAEKKVRLLGEVRRKLNVQ